MKLKVVEVPSIKEPITKSPGFAKKLLADYKLDLMALCGFGCRYCSSSTGNYLRINRERFADLTEEQLGERLFPTETPELTFTWPDVIEKLERQLHHKAKDWGKGKTLVVSQLTDAFSPLALASGTTEAALRLVLNKTSFRVRVLTKGAAVASDKWIKFFLERPERFVVGLSVGTTDDEWARRIEVGTSSPTARLKAHRALQDAGVPTFGMLCPVFPDALAGDGLDRLVDAIRPERCEDVWAEPYNDRDNWRVVRDGYPAGSYGARWMTSVYELNERSKWSEYATRLYVQFKAHAVRNGWIDRLKYLLYEGGIIQRDADMFANLAGVLLQDPHAKDGERETGWSRNKAIRMLQQHEGHGMVWTPPKPAQRSLPVV